MPEPFVVAFVPGVTPAKWARVWAERMPTIPLQLRPVSDRDAIAAVLDGSAAVALLRLPVVGEGLNVIPLYSETAVVVVPKEHPIAGSDAVILDDLDGENLLHGQDSATVELVAAGVGIAVMPQSLARLHSRKDVVARAVTDAPVTRVGLVWLADRTTPLVEEFAGIVRGRTAMSSRGITEDARARPRAARKAARPDPKQRRVPDRKHPRQKPRRGH